MGEGENVIEKGEDNEGAQCRCSVPGAGIRVAGTQTQSSRVTVHAELGEKLCEMAFGFRCRLVACRVRGYQDKEAPSRRPTFVYLNSFTD